MLLFSFVMVLLDMEELNIYTGLIMRKWVFLFSLSFIFLASAVTAIIQKPSTVSGIFNSLFPTPTPEVMKIKGIGIIGDSLSDEYQADDARGYQYAPTTLNWIEQLVKNRNLNFGLWGTWGDVRRTGFAYNWAQSGQTTDDAINNGQHIGLAQQVKNGEVNLVIIYIGANDFFPFRDTYTSIYNGTLNGNELDSRIQEIMSNFTAIIDTVTQAGSVKVLIMTIPDWNLSPAVQLTNQDQQGRQRVSAVIERINSKLREIAAKRHFAIVDANAFYHTILIDAPLGSIRVGTEDISLYIPGDEPHHAFLSDTVHPGTVVNGVFANYVLNQMNQDFHTAIQPLSEEEILSNAGM